MDTLTMIFLAHLICSSADGISTDYAIKTNRFVEIYPAKIVLGEQPTWQTMIPWGIIEIAALTKLSDYLRDKKIKYWYLPQYLTICAHGFGIGINIGNIYMDIKRR